MFPLSFNFKRIDTFAEGKKSVRNFKVTLVVQLVVVILQKGCSSYAHHFKSLQLIYLHLNHLLQLVISN